MASSALRSANVLSAASVADLDVVQCPGTLGFGARLGLGQDGLLGVLGIAAGLVQQLAHLVGGQRELLLVLGQQVLGLAVVPLGLGNVVGDALLAPFQRLDDRLPGELAQHDQQDDEHQ